MELLFEAGRQVGTAASSTVSFAGFLDGEMDSKGMCSSPHLVRAGTECQRISGLVLGALFRAREWEPFHLRLLPVLPPSSTLSSPVFLFQVPAIEENLPDDKHLLKPWDAKKVGVAHCPSSFHGVGLQGPPLSSVLICHLLPSLLSCPHPPPDLGPVKSLELSTYLSEVG